jgi:hypothetical protein
MNSTKIMQNVRIDWRRYALCTEKKNFRKKETTTKKTEVEGGL